MAKNLVVKFSGIIGKVSIGHHANVVRKYKDHFPDGQSEPISRLTVQISRDDNGPFPLRVNDGEEALRTFVEIDCLPGTTVTTRRCGNRIILTFRDDDDLDSDGALAKLIPRSPRDGASAKASTWFEQRSPRAAKIGAQFFVRNFTTKDEFVRDCESLTDHEILLMIDFADALVSANYRLTRFQLEAVTVLERMVGRPRNTGEQEPLAPAEFGGEAGTE